MVHFLTMGLFLGLCTVWMSAVLPVFWRYVTSFIRVKVDSGQLFTYVWVLVQQTHGGKVGARIPFG
jgi:hypothetical protein